MLTALGLDTVLTQPCPSCAVVHQLRVVVTEEDAELGASMCAFFDRCPNTGERVWLVVNRPDGLAGRMRHFGPVDQLDWEPADNVQLVSALPPPAAVRESRPGPARSSSGPRSAITPLLRLAWGCPY